MQQRTDNLNLFRQKMDQLTMMIQGAKAIPLTNTCRVDRDEALRAINDIRESLPVVIQECDSVVLHQNSIINVATEKAQSIQADATSWATQYYKDAQNKVEQMQATANRQATDLVNNAQQKAAAMVQEAREQANHLLQEAQAKADQMVSEEEVLLRARNEAETLKQNTQQEVERLYSEVYHHIDDVLAQLDRSISEKLTDIRLTRQQIDQSMS